MILLQPHAPLEAQDVQGPAGMPTKPLPFFYTTLWITRALVPRSSCLRKVWTGLRGGGWTVLLCEHGDPLRMGESWKQGEKRRRTQVPAWVYLPALPSHLIRTARNLKILNTFQVVTTKQLST